MTMDKAGLLKTIAETGYNVGFGAKKTFATFDMVEKLPGWIGFASFGIGVYALYVDALASKFPSATLIIAGVGALYFSLYRPSEYQIAGKQMIQLFNRLRDLYREVESGADLTTSRAKLSQIESEFYSITVSKQVFLSDWYAHYKFFAQTQIDWMAEQIKFRVWRDMIPLSAKTVIVLSMLAGVVYAVGSLVAGHVLWMQC